MEEKKQQEPGDETKQKMLDILKRFHSEEEADSMDTMLVSYKLVSIVNFYFAIIFCIIFLQSSDKAESAKPKLLFVFLGLADSTLSEETLQKIIYGMFNDHFSSTIEPRGGKMCGSDRLGKGSKLVY